LTRSQSPDKAEEKGKSPTVLVRDYAEAYGLYPVRIEGVGLVAGLPGTGSDPAPSSQRDALVSEMRGRNVDSPNSLLASKNFAMVVVQGYLRPGIQAGDRFDVEVRVPSQSETTSLRGGYLLPVRLREMQVMEKDNSMHEGHVLAIAEGAIMVDPSAKADKGSIGSCRGRVLSGGRALKPRKLYLVLKPDHQSVVYSARIETAVNKRFHSLEKGVHVGMAKAETDKRVDLQVHPRYKDNIERYMEVVRSIATKETPAEAMRRLARLKNELLDPATAASAARQLEAIGQDGVETLRAGAQSRDSEVQFYAAEALAYLDQREAAQPLAHIARDEPAFRIFALSALSAMENREACEQLETLLHVPSAETRYGAFRALWTADPTYPSIAPDPQIKEFGYHVITTSGPPMIHVTRSKRPEVVLFGKDQKLRAPFALNAGTHIMVTARDDGVTVSKFIVGQPDQKRVVSYQVDEVIRAITDLGGTYPDVVQALEEAHKGGALTTRFEVDALPEPGRTYQRFTTNPTEDSEKNSVRVKTPTPGLFRDTDGPTHKSGPDAATAEPAKSPDAT
jgi:hypothetical protein